MNNFDQNELQKDRDLWRVDKVLKKRTQRKAGTCCVQ